MLRHEKFIAQPVEQEDEADGKGWRYKKIDLRFPHDINVALL